MPLKKIQIISNSVTLFIINIFLIFKAGLNTYLNRIGEVLIISILIIIVTSTFSILLKFMIEGYKSAFRIAIILSISWFLMSFIIFKPYLCCHIYDFIIGSIFPIFLFWGIFWILKGFKEDHL